MINLEQAINILEQHITNPSIGLPQEVFFFISRITPLVNVDLLIKNKDKQTLLTWRDDGLGVPGWHVPGGIIRYKETIATRIKNVAKNELGAKVNFDPLPLAVNECIIKNRATRGHFISLLFCCSLVSPLDEKLKCKDDFPRANQWRWHETCPDNLIKVHDKMYKGYF